MGPFFANSEDPDQNAASDQGLHCLHQKQEVFEMTGIVNVIILSIGNGSVQNLR